MGIQVLLVSPSPPPYGGMALQAKFLERLLLADGIQVLPGTTNFPLPRWLNRWGIRTLARAVMIWFHLWRQSAQADVVHVLAASWLYFFIAVYPAVVVGRLRRKHVVVNYRGGEAREFFARFGALAAPVFRLASIVTTPSQFLAEIIRKRFRVEVHIVPNIVDTSRFSFRQRKSIRPKLLVTRHLEKIYDVESILRAFRSVQEHFPNASLWIAGSGSEEERLRTLAAQWKLQDVRFLGHVTQNDLPAIYDQCDIYINASRVDNFPGALLEASAAGLVVVSTSAGGIRFLYDDGKNALLVEPGDWEGLAVAVERAIREPTMALEMAANAISLARACDWKEVRKLLYEAYFAGSDFSSPDRGLPEFRGGI